MILKSKLLMLLILCYVSAIAQIKNPVMWSYAAKKISSNEALLYVKATIQPGWHIYSMNQKEGGPEKTTFIFSQSKEFSLTGKVTEPMPIKKYEEVFEMDVFYFEKSVIFQQKIKLNKSDATIKGKISFMVCTDKECLPATEVNFSIPVK